MRAELSVSDVILSALRSGMRAASNVPEVILLAGKLGMSERAHVSAVLILYLGMMGKSVVCHSPVEEILLFGSSGIRSTPKTPAVVLLASRSGMSLVTKLSCGYVLQVVCNGNCW